MEEDVLAVMQSSDCVFHWQVYNIGTDWQKLHEVIDPAYLPPQYGGTLLSDSMESIHQVCVCVCVCVWCVWCVRSFSLNIFVFVSFFLAF